MIVIDASAAIELVARTPVAPAIDTRFMRANNLACAPHLIDLEIAQGLRRWVSLGRISEARADTALADWRRLTILRYPHDQILGRIWQLRHNMTAYDAAYIALAEMIGAPLVTCDQKLANAPRQHRARIEVL